MGRTPGVSRWEELEVGPLLKPARDARVPARSGRARTALVALSAALALAVLALAGLGTRQHLRASRAKEVISSYSPEQAGAVPGAPTSLPGSLSTTLPGHHIVAFNVNMCLTRQSESKGSFVTSQPCEASSSKQKWVFERPLTTVKTLEGKCLDNGGELVHTWDCFGGDIGLNQQWVYDENTWQIRSVKGFCLEASNSALGKALLRPCSEQSAEQKWSLRLQLMAAPTPPPPPPLAVATLPPEPTAPPVAAATAEPTAAPVVATTQPPQAAEPEKPAEPVRPAEPTRPAKPPREPAEAEREEESPTEPPKEATAASEGRPEKAVESGEEDEKAKEVTSVESCIVLSLPVAVLLCLCVALFHTPDARTEAQKAPTPAEPLTTGLSQELTLNSLLSVPSMVSLEPPERILLVQDPRPSASARGDVPVVAFGEEGADVLCRAPWLSNRYEHAVGLELEGKHLTFRNAEAAFAALLFWPKAEEFSSLAAEEVALKRKELSGEEDWNFAGLGNSWQAMHFVLNSKFRSGTLLDQALERSGDSFLLYHSFTPGERVWSDNAEGDGQNLLGMMLMLLREKRSGWRRWTCLIEDTIDRDTGEGLGGEAARAWAATVRNSRNALEAELRARRQGQFELAENTDVDFE